MRETKPLSRTRNGPEAATHGSVERGHLLRAVNQRSLTSPPQVLFDPPNSKAYATVAHASEQALLEIIQVEPTPPALTRLDMLRSLGNTHLTYVDGAVTAAASNNRAPHRECGDLLEGRRQAPRGSRIVSAESDGYGTGDHQLIRATKSRRGRPRPLATPPALLLPIRRGLSWCACSS
jgi:hypothetical protein